MKLFTFDYIAWHKKCTKDGERGHVMLFGVFQLYYIKGNSTFGEAEARHAVTGD